MSNGRLIEQLKQWARAIKRDLAALRLAARDPRVPWYAKILAVGVAAYALSPIDLIPDFIPVLGYLDDLLIVPGGIWLAVQLIPADVMKQLRAEAQGRDEPVSLAGAAAIIVLWILCAAVTMQLLI